MISSRRSRQQFRSWGRGEEKLWETRSLSWSLARRTRAGETTRQIRCVIVIINDPYYHREARERAGGA